MIVVLPLFSASVAYWLGSREVSEAKKEANEARNRAAIASQQLAVVLAEGGKAFLPQAKETYPNLFNDL